MAYTPMTPVQKIYGEFGPDTPIDPAAMSSPLAIKPTIAKSKRLSKKQKVKAAFASLYDDEPELPNWTPGSIGHTISDLTLEDVGGETDTFEVKDGDVSAVVEVPSGSMVTCAKVVIVEPTIRTEWLGTSQFYLEPLLELQRMGGLDGVIAYRAAVEHDVACFPFDPAPLLTLSGIHGKLGFSDISVANAHRALLLIEAAMQINSFSLATTAAAAPIFHVLNMLAQSMLITKYKGFRPHVLDDELQVLHRQAYQMLLAGLLGTGANWDGLLIVKTAVKLYPQDIELKQLQYELKAAFMDRCQVFKDGGEHTMKKADIIELTRVGKIYQKKYPYMDQDLYRRTPATLREANIAFEGSSCEVKVALFGNAQPKVLQEGEDVGPLGIYATRDIDEGELVMLDKTVTGVSNIPSSKLEHCDACQGCLLPPYVLLGKIVYAPCCGKVAYCCLECYKVASNGYHQVLCGQDFDWLYEMIKTGKASGAPTHWKTVNFLRIVAVILADARTTKVHPLQHPLMARMSANYPPEGKIMGQYDSGHQWLYFTNVVAPTQILLQLGVNVYTDPFWSQEVIQTIFWRIENNANMATTELFPGKISHLVNINPNYLFFNHSCQPNVSWHGACPDGEVGLDWLMTSEGDLMQPGCSAVWCIAARDIKKGEQLTISYVGNPKGDDTIEGGREAKRAWLWKWFDGGCGCPMCEEENRVEAEKAKAAKESVRSNSVETCNRSEGVVEC